MEENFSYRSRPTEFSTTSSLVRTGPRGSRTCSKNAAAPASSRSSPYRRFSVSRLMVDHAAHSMLVRPPFREARQVFEDAFGVGVEDMRSVVVHQYTVLVRLVVGIAGNVHAFVDDMHMMAGIGQFAGHDGAGVAGSVNHDFFHGRIPHFICRLPLIPSRPSNIPQHQAHSCAPLRGSRISAAIKRINDPGSTSVNSRRP